MLGAHIQHVAWNRLAKRDSVGFQQSAASRTFWRQLLEANRVAVESSVAIKASNPRPGDVKFRERLLSRLPMQVIDVLRDHETQNSQLLQFREREMPGVRLRNRERLEQFVVAFI